MHPLQFSFLCNSCLYYPILFLAYIDLFSIPIQSTEDQPMNVSHISLKSIPQIKRWSRQLSNHTNKCAYHNIFTHHRQNYEAALQTIAVSEAVLTAQESSRIPRDRPEGSDNLHRRTSSSRSLRGTNSNFTCTSPSPSPQRGPLFIRDKFCYLLPL